MVKQYRAKELESTLPILAIENDCLISVHGDITLAFKITLPEIYTCSEKDYQNIHADFVKALTLLPSYTLMHKQDWFMAENYVPQYHPEISFLSRSFEQHFFERPFLNHYAYIFLTKYPKERMKTNSLYTTLSRGKLVPKEIKDGLAVQDFLDKVQQFKQVLEASELLQLERLTGEELAGDTQNPGLLENYLSLNTQAPFEIQDIHF